MNTTTKVTLTEETDSLANFTYSNTITSNTDDLLRLIVPLKNKIMMFWYTQQMIL